MRKHIFCTFALESINCDISYGNLHNHTERTDHQRQGSDKISAGAGSADAQGYAQIQKQLPPISGGQASWTGREVFLK